MVKLTIAARIYVDPSPNSQEWAFEPINPSTTPLHITYHTVTIVLLYIIEIIVRNMKSISSRIEFFQIAFMD